MTDLAALDALQASCKASTGSARTVGGSAKTPIPKALKKQDPKKDPKR
jgi:hypothetical protein